MRYFSRWRRLGTEQSSDGGMAFRQAHLSTDVPIPSGGRVTVLPGQSSFRIDASTAQATLVLPADPQPGRLLYVQVASAAYGALIDPNGRLIHAQSTSINLSDHEALTISYTEDSGWIIR